MAKQNQAQMRAAGRLAMRLGVKQLHTVFRAWWRRVVRVRLRLRERG